MNGNQTIRKIIFFFFKLFLPLNVYKYIVNRTKYSRSFSIYVKLVTPKDCSYFADKQHILGFVITNRLG